MRSTSKARRSFLRGVGVGFASLPFFKLLEDSYVRAQGGTLPLRFVTLYHPHGIAAEYWGLQPGDTETNFNLSFPNASLTRCVRRTEESTADRGAIVSTPSTTARRRSSPAVASIHRDRNRSILRWISSWRWRAS